MCSMRTIAVAFTTCLVAGPAGALANIIPSWRVNTIPLAASLQLPPGAISLSLVVELTGGSLFNTAGLDLSTLFPSVEYYNDPFGQDLGRPIVGIIPNPPETAFDTYVCVSTDPNTLAVNGGRLNGAGAGVVGFNGELNIIWSAAPNTGGTGLLEIARLTMTDVVLGSTEIPVEYGFVRDNLNPSVNVPLPPIPVAAVPEPALAGATICGIALCRRRR